MRLGSSDLFPFCGIIASNTQFIELGVSDAMAQDMAKNGAQVLTLFALGNLWMVRKHLLATTG